MTDDELCSPNNTWRSRELKRVFWVLRSKEDRLDGFLLRRRFSVCWTVFPLLKVYTLWRRLRLRLYVKWQKPSLRSAINESSYLVNAKFGLTALLVIRQMSEPLTRKRDEKIFKSLRHNCNAKYFGLLLEAKPPCTTLLPWYGPERVGEVWSRLSWETGTASQFLDRKPSAAPKSEA